MAFGIMAGSAAGLLLLGLSGIAPMLFALSFFGGMTWVAGNYLLIVAVAKAGMARSFIVINFAAVLSFIGGVLLLGELPYVTLTRLALLAGAVGLVLLGSILVTTTTPRVENGGNRHRLGDPARKGLAAAFAATVFFSLYNVMIAVVINKAGTPPGTTFISIAPGVVLGAFLVACLAGGGELRQWRSAPARWHLLAIAQGLIWAAAMVCIMFGWMSTGIAIGTPVQLGTQTLVSSLWGILMFGEFKGLENKGGAFAKYIAGAALTVSGIAIMVLS
jgi:glucose uptake protein GlcU